MSTENNIPAESAVTDDLDAFAAELFGESTQPSDNAKSEETPEESTVEVDAPTEDTQPAENDGNAEDSEESEENPENDTDEPEEKPKKLSRAEERIKQAVARQREAERERDELARRLAEATKTATTEEKSEELKTPKPSDTNEDGTPKYPLGEFDPKYMEDRDAHLLATVQKMLNDQAKAKEPEKVTPEQEYRNTLQESWNTKLVDVQERYPDFQEKGQEMLSVFEGIDEAYGQYLTDVLMEMEAGPEVFYYLANNLDEANEIVNAGPRKATMALTKLEMQLAGNSATKVKPVKTTNAPPPPPQLKGSAVSKASVPLDTNDLDAFSKVLFSKK